LSSLHGESRNQSSTDTATILSSSDIDRVTLTSGPIQDLAQSLSIPFLKVRVLIEDTAVGSNVAGLNFLLLADGSNAAGGKASSAGTDELSKMTAELQLGLGQSQGESLREKLMSLGKVLIRIAGDLLVHFYRRRLENLLLNC
jgi:hypothetical protein